MNSSTWTAVAALAFSVASFLNALTAQLQTRKINQKVDNHLNDVNKPQ